MVEEREAVTATAGGLDQLTIVLDVEGAGHASDLHVYQGRGRLCPLERLDVGRAQRDHESLPVAVARHRLDPVARREEDFDFLDAGEGAHAFEPRHRSNPADRKRPRLRGQERDGERLLEPVPDQLVRDRLPQRLPERHLHEVDSDRALRHLVHLTRGDTRGDLDQQRLVLRDEHLRVHDGVADAERSDHVAGDPLHLLLADRRRESTGRRARPRLRSPRLRAAVGPRASRSPARRRGRRPARSPRALHGSSRRSPPRSSTPRAPRADAPPGRRRCAGGRARAGPAQSAGFSTAGKADPLERILPLVDRADGGEGGLRDPRLREAAPHRHLVGHAVRHLRADARQAELLGDRGDDRDGTVGGDRDARRRPRAGAHLRERRNVEADDLRLVSFAQTRRVRVPIRRDDADVRARERGRSRASDGARRRRTGLSSRRPML